MYINRLDILKYARSYSLAIREIEIEDREQEKYEKKMQYKEKRKEKLNEFREYIKSHE